MSRYPCDKEGYCTSFLERIGPQNSGKGLSYLQAVNIATMKEVWHGVVYKKTVKDRGLFLNFCPWCGNDLKKLGHHPQAEEGEA